jgi:hypothetical protein
MNDNEDDRDLQRLFAGYEPAITAEPFLGQILAGLDREIRRAQLRSAVVYVLTATVIIAVAAATAAPLAVFMHALETSLGSFATELSPLKSQALIYVATLGLIALGRRRLRAFIEPW